MSRHEFEPGDVAEGTWNNGSKVTVVRYDTGAEVGWWVARGTSRYYADADFSDLRPLVVIDPEDREQVALLALAYCGEKASEVEVDAMHAALRSLIDPPKPEEPTGKFAVVSDGSVTWVRAAWNNDRPWNKIGTDVWAEYADIDAQTVHSEGMPS